MNAGWLMMMATTIKIDDLPLLETERLLLRPFTPEDLVNIEKRMHEIAGSCQNQSIDNPRHH